MNNSEFFQSNYNRERDSWLKADGQPPIFVSDNGWRSVWDNDQKGSWNDKTSWAQQNESSWKGDGSWSAEGPATGGGETTQGGGMSAPYILQIVNACTSAISDVDIGDAFVNRINPSALYNFGQNANITTTSTVAGVTYLEFLAQSESKPFTVGKTMIISTSAGQLDQTVAITHRNASGDRQDHVITPTLDPFQNQTDRIIDSYEYLFDGMTRLRFNQINGSARVSIRFYQKNMFSATQIVAGRPAEMTYGAPGFITPVMAAGLL